MITMGYWLMNRKEHRYGAWGRRLLPRFKDMNGKRYQLHATKGWRCVGKAEGSNNA